MGDEFDVDDLLEAPYKVKTEPEVNSCINIFIYSSMGIMLIIYSFLISMQK